MKTPKTEPKAKKKLSGSSADVEMTPSFKKVVKAIDLLPEENRMYIAVHLFTRHAIDKQKDFHAIASGDVPDGDGAKAIFKISVKLLDVDEN